MGKSSVKIGIYSPYLDTFGGGEKYMLTIAQTLADKSEVEILIGTHLYDADIDKIKEKVQLLHNISFERINFIKAPIGEGSSFIKRISFLKKYDVFFYITDGSIFYSSAKRSYIHFQVPFKNLAAQGIWGKIKLSSFKKAIYNSEFTKKYIEESWKVKGQVIYPPVSVNIFHPKPKKKQIVSVGRFFGYLKDKKQDFLIEVFKQLSLEKDFKGWSLHLAGGAGEGDVEYILKLKELSKGYPVYFYPNIPLEQLKKLYEEAYIYWHASGYEEIDPAKMEHFGITTVEGMAAGCVPVVIKKGGQLEIVEDEISGLFWENIEELKEKTLFLIQNPQKAKKLSEGAIKRSKTFSKERFVSEIRKLVYEN